MPTELASPNTQPWQDWLDEQTHPMAAYIREHIANLESRCASNRCVVKEGDYCMLEIGSSTVTAIPRFITSYRDVTSEDPLLLSNWTIEMVFDVVSEDC